MRVLFATSEIYPLVKTGGLGDVAAGLSTALHELGHEVRVILPAYQAVKDQLGSVEELAQTTVWSCGVQRRVYIRCAEMASGVSVLLVDIPALFDRPGNPYQAEDGNDWWDNGERFGLFSRIVAQVALDQFALGWCPEVVHCNDWQTGLVPVFLRQFGAEAEDVLPVPRTIFTIHNLSYAGRFPRSLYTDLGLPDFWWHHDKLEFYGDFSTLKGGMVFADQVTTVSPAYAEEICTSAHGFGFEGVLRQRALQGELSGILNGIDPAVWNPARDPYIAYPYSVKKGRVAQKKRNKQTLLETLAHEGVSVDYSAPLLGFIGRLVEQKGVDLLVQAIPVLLQETNANVAMLGSGLDIYEEEFVALAQLYPQRIFAHVGYSEELAHRIEAGADIFLMPSRFEPCGLNQLYSLAYGTPPIVHATGGLNDTVVDVNAESLADGSASGFVMQEPTVAELCRCAQYALELYHKPRTWQKLQKSGMLQDFGWQRSAAEYVDLYSS